MRFPRIQNPLWVLAIRNIPSSPTPVRFQEWVRELSPSMKTSCIGQASRILDTGAPIYEDGQALLAISSIAGEDEVVRLNAFGKLNAFWKERCEKLAPPEA